MVPIRFGYTICYVDDVRDALAFYEAALGLKTRFVNVEGEMQYGELETGETVLAFASHALATASAGEECSHRPAAFEIAFVTDDVAAAVAQSVAAGATLVRGPTEKPWGQTVAYVRDPDGILVELCTPMPTA